MSEKNRSEKKIEKKTIVLLGDCNVGKTRIIKKYINPEDNEIEDSSIGINIIEKEIDNNQILKIVDTSGQERNKGITHSVYKKADAFIVVFDMNNKESYNNITFWIDLIVNYGKKDTIIYVVGNKTNGGDSKELIEIQNFLKHHGQYEKSLIDNIHYEEVNLENNFNIDKIFKGIIEQIDDSNLVKQNEVNNQGSRIKCYLY